MNDDVFAEIADLDPQTARPELTTWEAIQFAGRKLALMERGIGSDEAEAIVWQEWDESKRTE